MSFLAERDPSLSLGTQIASEDQNLGLFVSRWPVLGAKLLELRGISELGPEDRPYFYAASIIADEAIASASDDVKEEAFYWVDPSTPTPIAQDFSYIDLARLAHFAQQEKGRGFLKIAIECLPLTLDQQNIPGIVPVGIFEFRKPELKAYEPKRQIKVVTKREAHGKRVNTLKTNKAYL